MPPISPLPLFEDVKVIPVITIDRVADAIPLARALVAGGVRHLEVTLRTPAAADAARAIAAEVEGAVLGIGTVLAPDDLALAESVGARFALSPGATPELLDAAAEASIPFIPGVATASEVMAALARGFQVMKFFPAAVAGGIPGIKALSGPFPQVRFCPTGGIGPDNMAQWLGLAQVFAVGGSWLTPADAVRDGNWPEITRLAREAVERAP